MAPGLTLVKACYLVLRRYVDLRSALAPSEPTPHFQRLLSVSGVADAIHIATYYIGNILIEANERMPSSNHSTYRPTSNSRGEEEKERLAKEAEEKTKGMFNPHKSLRKLLGEDQKKQQKMQKVAVVLDPKLSKVLRPHQIEGAKVRHSFAPTPGFASTASSSCTGVRLE